MLLAHRHRHALVYLLAVMGLAVAAWSNLGQPLTPVYAASQSTPNLPQTPPAPTGYPVLAYPGGVPPVPPPTPLPTNASPQAYVEPFFSTPVGIRFRVVLAELARLMAGVAVALALGLLAWRWRGTAWRLGQSLARWGAAIFRTRAGRMAASVLVLAAVGIAAFQLAFAPVWPLPPGSTTAQALWGVYLDAQEMGERIRCQDAPVTFLADYYADTRDHRQLDLSERDWIEQAFGPAALDGAGLLTARQAYYIAFVGAIPAPGVPNPLGMAVPSERNAETCRYPFQSTTAPIGYWVNAQSDLAVVRYTVAVCTGGQFDLVLRWLDSRWKLVDQHVHKRCQGMG